MTFNVVDEISKIQFFDNENPSAAQGAFLVIVEMSLALVGIVLNLTVLISIRGNESLLNSTLNVLLGNLCFANLISAVFVKSIAVIYHGYAVATSKWEIEIAFCTIHTVTSRATWAVFPYTIVALCWIGLINRISKLLATLGARGKSIEFDDEEMGIEYEEEVEGIGSKQKVALGFVWAASAGYSVISNVLLSKERDLKCSVRADLTEKFNMISIIAAIGVPIIAGPILCPIAHIFITLCSCFIEIVKPARQPPRQSQVKQGDKEGETGSTGGSGSRGGCIACAINTGFILIFTIFYPTHMYVTETYFANHKSLLPFMFIKYCVGSLHLIMLPIIILMAKSDIRNAASEQYVKKSTQNDSTEITFEQLQENLGIGVQVD